MSRYTVRALHPDDFNTLMGLEESLFGGTDDGTLGPYYVRLCASFFSETCFIAFRDDEPVGYLLAFVRNREAYCTTLGLLPEVRGTRVLPMLIREFIRAVQDQADACWFTVEEDNTLARALHQRLGARELVVDPAFYGEGRPRILSRIDREAFHALRARYARLGLVETEQTAPPPRVQPRLTLITASELAS
jgi:ribosomal protein S18 acetylase RimI-like enzyme